MRHNLFQGKKAVALFLLLLVTVFNLFPVAQASWLGHPVAKGSLPTYTEACEQTLRFHVLAHSDHPGDQEIKNDLAAFLLPLLQEELAGIASREEAIFLLQQVALQQKLASRAKSFLLDRGFFYPVQVQFLPRIFPARQYSGIILPPGEYLALTVIIGEGAGENWWCLLFPALCIEPFLIPETDAAGNTGSQVAFPPPPPRFAIWEQIQKIYSVIVKIIPW